MKRFYLNPCFYNKWEYQQREDKEIECGCEFMCDGVLLDNFLISCKNGIALLNEHYLNHNLSDYLVTFARYNDKDGVDEIFDIYEKGVVYDD